MTIAGDEVLAFATLGLYMFYPATEEVLDEITGIRVELYSAAAKPTSETRRRSAH